MLQQSVDALFDNNRCKRPVLGSSNRPLKSLTDMIKGKQGRFRENLLGKRVDYSARSVIVVGPELHLHQCGLPKKIALELFQPFIIRRLKELGHADTIKSAKKMLERKADEVWDILEEVTKSHAVLLNRAPTLHRMGIQAFEPVLIEGNAIRIHPLVCKGFNADFDGDQMAVHLPLSIEPQVEATVLVMYTNDIFIPSNGIVRTTVGRVIFNDILNSKMSYYDLALSSKHLSRIIADCYQQLGRRETIALLDRMKEIGFRESTRSGLSFATDDLRTPANKEVVLKKAEKEVEKVLRQYERGIITDRERYNKVIDEWTK